MCLKSQVYNCVVMPVGSSTWVKVIVSSLRDKVTSGVGDYLCFGGESTTYITCHVYLLLGDLDSSPPINPPVVMLSVWNIGLSSLISYSSLSPPRSEAFGSISLV